MACRKNILSIKISMFLMFTLLISLFQGVFLPTKAEAVEYRIVISIK